MVLGAPFTVDGVTYTPEDKLNYDQVGQAVVGAGEGVTIAHRTLPLPSYAEVTSLESGRTVLVRVTRRGPMEGKAIVELSPAAAAQLGVSAVTPIRIRRVNPPETERAALRSGGQAPLRMDTPISLVNVLRRKLDPSLAALPLPGAPAAPPVEVSAPVAKPAPAPQVAAVHVAEHPAPPTKPAPKPAPVAAKPQPGLLVQVGAFSTAERGGTAARKVGGQVSPAGKFYRVRMGPFSSRGEADAALAKAKGAGYSDARIQRAD